MGKLHYTLCILILCGNTLAISFVSKREEFTDIFTSSRHRRDIVNTFDSDSPRSHSKYVVKDNHKPVFTECSTYNITVKEEESINTFVTTVQAYDEDPPKYGGTLTYSFVLREGERGKFSIDNVTGEIRTLHSFDRDEPSRNKEVYVTVQATDNGRPTLADICTFKITILDINDNTPIFDKTSYSESVPQDLPVNREVMRISATDIDDGVNSVVSYSFQTPIKYFRIDENTGFIYLNQSLMPEVQVGKIFKIFATAKDHGKPSNSISTELEIKVVDSNKKAPTFIDVPTAPIYLAENFRDYESTIAKITAQSNMENEELLFFLETGRTEQTNKLNNFIIVTTNKSAEIKLGRDLDYESNTEYTLQIRVQNKDFLSASTKVIIKVTDVNDNIPAFMEFVPGNVLENEDPGTPVMQVQAVDLDGTEANNIVSYELADYQDLFQIDPKTGNITTKARFDREANSVYNVKVIAKDNSPSALKKNGEPNMAEQRFRIVIEDKNDNPPKFTKNVYVAENILESSDIRKVVIEVKAEDKDTASVIQYSIIEGNIDNAFSIEPVTGLIRVQNNLDYETRTSYELKVLADDGKFNDTAIVKISIENVNDMLPEFIDFKKKVYIDEEELVEGCLVKVQAYDPDIADRNAPQNIKYGANPVKGEQYLTVEDEGCIRLTKTLDRDPPNGSVEWQVFVTATDENSGPTSQTKTESFIIHLMDINDNAPFLNISEVVWYENEPITDFKFITILTAEDYDNETINGPPFKYRLADNSTKEIFEKFEIRDDKLYPLVTFDREEKKMYSVFIAITDNGTPTQTGISELRVIIGDVNDNEMRPGSSEIYVNSIGEDMPETVIGRIYVEDEDDWDLDDKTFYWKIGSHPQFDLDRFTGEIKMLQGTEEGSYFLEFRVTEKSKYIAEHEVHANVTIIVKVIPRIAIVRSGSMRLHGINEEDFISTNIGVSHKEKLHNKLATILNVTRSNLDILSIAHSPFHKNEDVLDIRYSAHGSPYYYPEKLNTITTLRADELDELIQMTNIAECMYENVCPNLSCTNYLNISNVPVVVNTNRTSYVSISATVEPKCTCDVYEPPQCLNNGVLIEDTLCNCVEGFDGPHCESLSIGFYGSGYALYPSFQTCNHSEITLEITTIQENGLIFYIGPIRHNPLLPVKDFMSLELKNGYPLLLLDYGSGTIDVLHNYKKLNDGKTHFIHIIFEQRSVELKVDNCAMSNCLKFSAVSGPNRALNVNGPLQVGGTVMDIRQLASEMSWNSNITPTSQGFNGCIRNLTYNGKTYDLGNPGYSKNVNFNCNGITASAAKFGIDTNFLVALLVCLAILLILLLAVVVHRRKQDNYNDKDMDDIRENIINYEDEGGGEVDTGFDLNVLRRENYFDDPHTMKPKEGIYLNAVNPVPADISGFLLNKKESCDKDPDCNPFDDVRYYAYEGDGNTSRSSLSSLASCTDEGDLKFNYLSNFGPRFRKLADMYGEEPSDDDDQDGGEESWC